MSKNKLNAPILVLIASFSAIVLLIMYMVVSVLMPVYSLVGESPEVESDAILQAAQSRVHVIIVLIVILSVVMICGLIVAIMKSRRQSKSRVSKTSL